MLSENCKLPEKIFSCNGEVPNRLFLFLSKDSDSTFIESLESAGLHYIFGAPSVLRQKSLYFDCHSGLDPESSIS